MFERQKKFEKCKNKKILSFDFYIPLKNILIEYDGKQHYSPIKLYGGIDGFNKTALRDSIKTKWAKDNNYNLIRIKFDMKKEEIEKLLKEILTSDFEKVLQKAQSREYLDTEIANGDFESMMHKSQGLYGK